VQSYVTTKLILVGGLVVTGYLVQHAILQHAHAVHHVVRML